MPITADDLIQNILFPENLDQHNFTKIIRCTPRFTLNIKSDSYIEQQLFFLI